MMVEVIGGHNNCALGVRIMHTVNANQCSAANSGTRPGCDMTVNMLFLCFVAYPIVMHTLILFSYLFGCVVGTEGGAVYALSSSNVTEIDRLLRESSRARSSSLSDAETVG